MSGSTHTKRAPQRRRAASAGLALLALVLFVGCDFGSRIIGTAATPSPDASLRALTISAGTLTPAFDSATTSYVTAVTVGTASIHVTPAATSAGATIVVNGTAVTSGSASPDVALPVGTTTIIIVVTGSDAVTTRTYTITVVRAAS